MACRVHLTGGRQEACRTLSFFWGEDNTLLMYLSIVKQLERYLSCPFFPAKRFLLPFSVVGRCGNVALFFSLLLYLFVLFFIRAHFAFFARRMLKTFGAVFCSPNTEQASCVYLAWHSLHARIRTAQTITSRQYCLLYPGHVHVVYASVWYLQ